jgi:hypothetical protein
LLHDGPAELRIRESELLREHERSWLGDVPDHCSKWMFHRGFVEYVEIPAVNFIRHGSEMFSQQPIRSALVSFRHAVEVGQYPPDWTDCPSAATGWKPKTWSSWAESFSHLHRLIMIRNELSDSHVALLTSSDRLDQLQVLDLTDNDVRNHGVHSIVNSPNLKKLTSLILNTNSVRLLGARAIAESPYLRELRHLDLRNNQIPRRGIDLVRARFGRNVCEV